MSCSAFKAEACQGEGGGRSVHAKQGVIELSSMRRGNSSQCGTAKV